MTHLYRIMCVFIHLLRPRLRGGSQGPRGQGTGRTKDHISDKHFDSDERERVKHVFARPSSRSVRPSDGTAWRGGLPAQCVCACVYPCLHIHRQ